MIVPNRVLPSLGQVRLADENQVEPLDLRFVSSVLSAREQKNWRERQLQANLYKELRAMQTPAGPENGIGGFTPYNPYMQKAQDAYMNNYNQILDHASQTMDNVKDPLEVEKVLFQGAQKLFTPEYRQAYAQSKQFESYIKEFTEHPEDYDPTEVYGVLNDFYVSQGAFDMSKFRSADLQKVDLDEFEKKFLENFKTQKAVEYKDIGGGTMGVVKTDVTIDPAEASSSMYDVISKNPTLAKKYKNIGLEGDALKAYLDAKTSGQLGHGDPIYDKDGNVIGQSRITDITNVKTAAEASGAGTSSADERMIQQLVSRGMDYKEALKLVLGRKDEDWKSKKANWELDPDNVYDIKGFKFRQGDLTGGDPIDADLVWRWGASGLSAQGDRNDGRPRDVYFQPLRPTDEGAYGILWTNDPHMVKDKFGLDVYGPEVQKRDKKYPDGKLGEEYGITVRATNQNFGAYSMPTNNSSESNYNTAQGFSGYIGFTESRNNYNSNNPDSATGAWGTHNFIWGSHQAEIKELGKQMGYDIETPQDFLNHHDVQEAYFEQQDRTLYTPALPELREAAANSVDPWIRELSDDELKYVIHHEGSKQTALNYLRSGRSDYETMKDKEGKILNANSTEEIKKGIGRLRNQYGTAGRGNSLFKSTQEDTQKQYKPVHYQGVPEVSIQMSEDPAADTRLLLLEIQRAAKNGRPGMIQSPIDYRMFLTINEEGDPNKPFRVYIYNEQTQELEPGRTVSIEEIEKYVTNGSGN